MMADEKTVILKFEIDDQDLIQKNKELKKQILETKNQQKKLNKEFKSGNKSIEEYAAESTKLERDLKGLKKEYRDNEKTLSLYDTVVKNNAKSINSLGDEIKLLERELGKLENSYSTNEDGAVELSQEAQKLATKIKDLRGQQEQLRKAQGKSSFGQISEELSKISPQFSNLTGIVQQISDTLGGIKKTAGIAVKSMGRVKAAIAATGIGALVLAAIALFQAFTKTSKGAELLKRGSAALNAVLQVITGVLVDFGTKMIKAFEAPQQVIINLGDLIKTSLINRVKAFGVILSGIINLSFKKIADGVVQLGTGIDKATDRAVNFGKEIAFINKLNQQLVTLQLRIAREQGKLNVQAGKAVLEAEKLKNVRDNELKSIAERTSANAKLLTSLEKENKAKQQILSNDIQLLKKEQQIQNTIAKRLTANNKGGKNQTKLNDVLVKQREILLQLDQKQLEIAEQTADFEGKRNEQITNNVSLFRELVDAQLELQEAQAERELAKIRETSDKAFQVRRALITKRLQAEKLAAGEEGNLILAAQERANAAIIRLNKERSQAILNEAKNVIDLQLEVVKAGTKEELNLKIAQLQKELEKEKKFGQLRGAARDQFVRTTNTKIQKLRQDFNKQVLQDANQALLLGLKQQEKVNAKSFEDREKIALKILELEKQNSLISIEGTKNEQAQKLLIEAQFQEKKQQLQKAFVLQELEQQKADFEAEAILAEENNALKTQALVDAELKRREILLLNEQLTETQRQAIIFESEQKINNIKDDAAKKRIAQEQKNAKAIIGIAGSITDALISLSREESQERKSLAAIKKVITIAEITFNAQQAISALIAIETSTKGFLGLTTTGLTGAALIAAKAAASIAAVSGVKLAKGGFVGDQKPQKFVAGGFVKGSGTAISDSIPAQLSNGEFVVNAAATKNNRSLLESINSVGQQSTLTNINTGIGENHQLREALQDLQIFVEVSEINRVQNQVQVKEEITDI